MIVILSVNRCICWHKNCWHSYFDIIPSIIQPQIRIFSICQSNNKSCKRKSLVIKISVVPWPLLMINKSFTQILSIFLFINLSLTFYVFLFNTKNSWEHLWGCNKWNWTPFRDIFRWGGPILGGRQIRARSLCRPC